MSISQCSDVELIKRLFPDSGDEVEVNAAWVEFMKRFWPVFVNAIRSTHRKQYPNLKLTEDDICDLIQQLLYRLTRNEFIVLKSIDISTDKSIRLYLFSAASNITLNWLRYNLSQRRNIHCTSLINQVEHLETKANGVSYNYQKISNPETKLIQKDLIDKTLYYINKEAKTQTSKRNMHIFMLAYQYGLTVREIAEIDGINLTDPGINSILQRMREKFENFYLRCDSVS